jgi:hypothetical protein
MLAIDACVAGGLPVGEYWRDDGLTTNCPRKLARGEGRPTFPDAARCGDAEAALGSARSVHSIGPSGPARHDRGYVAAGQRPDVGPKGLGVPAHEEPDPGGQAMLPAVENVRSR